jgi:hypothetical protein
MRKQHKQQIPFMRTSNWRIVFLIKLSTKITAVMFLRMEELEIQWTARGKQIWTIMTIIHIVSVKVQTWVTDKLTDTAVTTADSLLREMATFWRDLSLSSESKQFWWRWHNRCKQIPAVLSICLTINDCYMIYFHFNSTRVHFMQYYPGHFQLHMYLGTGIT